MLLWLVRLWIFPSRRLGLGGWRGPGPFYFGRTVGLLHARVGCIERDESKLVAQTGGLILQLLLYLRR